MDIKYQSWASVITMSPKISQCFLCFNQKNRNTHMVVVCSISRLGVRVVTIFWQVNKTCASQSSQLWMPLLFLLYQSRQQDLLFFFLTLMPMSNFPILVFMISFFFPFTSILELCLWMVSYDSRYAFFSISTKFSKEILMI